MLVNLGSQPDLLPGDPAAEAVLQWGSAAPEGGGWRLGPDAVAVLRSPAHRGGERL